MTFESVCTYNSRTAVFLFFPGFPGDTLSTSHAYNHVFPSEYMNQACGVFKHQSMISGNCQCTYRGVDCCLEQRRVGCGDILMYSSSRYYSKYVQCVCDSIPDLAPVQRGPGYNIGVESGLNIRRCFER